MTEPTDQLNVLGLDGTESSLLDLVDNLLNQGVVVSGEVVLGLAGVDLIYLRLSAILCAADKLIPHLAPKPPEPRE
jgi:Gas vesicle protein